MSQNLFLKGYSRTDIELLSLLQQDALLSTVELARLTGLSANSVRKKRKEFKADGVIASEVAILNPEQVVGFIYFQVDLKLAGGRPDIRGAESAFDVDNPMILQCFHTTGPWDYRLLIVARGVSEFEKFSEKLFLNNVEIDRFESNLILRPVKFSFALPLQ